MTDQALNLSKNIRQLRESRGLSQEQLARLSGIPRPTWSNLESGAANPTLAVLARVASSLQVSIEELIRTTLDAWKFYPASQLATQPRRAAFIRKLLPESLPGVEFDRVEVSPRSPMAGIPHRTGTREYLTCERGTIELHV